MQLGLQPLDPLAQPIEVLNSPFEPFDSLGHRLPEAHDRLAQQCDLLASVTDVEDRKFTYDLLDERCPALRRADRHVHVDREVLLDHRERAPHVVRRDLDGGEPGRRGPDARHETGRKLRVCLAVAGSLFDLGDNGHGVESVVAALVFAVVASLYDELGVRADATAEELRRAYRQEARRRHPDMHPGREAEAEENMRRLNSAWTVLADPDRRRQYDAELAAAEVTIAPTNAVPSVHGFSLRFWPVIVAVLALITIVTAYAGSNTNGSRPAPASSDRPCLTAIPGLEDYVSCDQPNVGRLVVEVAPDQPCPEGSFRHLIQSRNRIACLTRS